MTLAAHAAISPSGIGRVSEWLSPWALSLPDLRNWEWFYLSGLCHRDLLTLRGNLGGVVDVAWDPAGKRLASAGSDSTIRIWDAATGDELLRLDRSQTRGRRRRLEPRRSLHRLGQL